MGRPPCCDKANVKRGLWTAEEDAKILAYVANHGVGNWTLVPQKAGLNRCGKSCRLRWTNYLRPDLKHDNFTPQEEQLILDLHEAIGSRWSLIAKQLPGRTDNDVKNYWNTKLRKKLSKMGIDPVTHKPFSQILCDYGNISGLPNSRNQITPFNHNNYNINNSNPMSTITSISNISDPNTNMINSNISASSSSSSVNWTSDFVFGDPNFCLINDLEECDLQNMLSSSSSVTHELQNENGFGYCHGGLDGSGQRNEQCCEGAASSSTSAASSFLEAMLVKDSEMRLEFPEIFSLLSS